jgi:DNA primase
MDYVQDLLKKEGLYFTVSGKDFLIKCLNPDHEDSNPSCRVDKITGLTHCFSCGFKTNIFKHFGLTGNHTSIKTAKLKEKLRELNISSNGVEFPGDMVPMTKPFRGISTKTLKEFGAFFTHASETLSDRVFFPITDIRGKPLLYVGRHMLSQGNPRYLNQPSGVTMPIFPEVYTEKYTCAILVEGIFDMLNLYDKGLRNVSCTFGTNTLQNNTASKLLALKTQGISKIYLMFDGDEAGRVAMTKLKPILEELEFLVEIITLEDGSDPGELSQEYVDSIKEYINGT